jgi:hypothetical protein
VKSAALWLLLLLLAAAAGYCAGNRHTPDATRPQLAASDSVLRDTRLHLATAERLNHQLADSLKASDTTVARYRREADRSAERARAAEAQTVAVRAQRATSPAGSGASDSVAFYREQLETADRELELLRFALEQRWEQLAAKDSIERIQHGQIALLAAAKDSAVAELTRVVPALEAARRAIATSEPRCQLAFGIPCPSRKAVAIGTAVAVVGVELLTRDRPREFVQTRNDSMLCSPRGVAIVRGC